MAENNPYPGTRAFEKEESDRFFGREDEARELLSLLVARRAVLLHSPSGAGKTSLIQAALRGRLEGLRQAVVLPTARVGDPLPPGCEPGNVYAFSVFQHVLEPSHLADAARWTLAEGLGRILDAAPAAPHFLILDQFEEIFTTHPDRYLDREPFFRQLGEALDRHRRLSLLLAMREDYMAQLTPFLPLFPDRLRARQRLDLLDEKKALAAVTLPAESRKVHWDEDTARRLVDELRRERVTDAHGRTVEQLGPHVDPVHLQIVCSRIWDRLAAGADEIGPEQLSEVESVDDTLAGYYREQVARVARAAGVGERTLRDWFGRRLITPGGIRSQVLCEGGKAEGIPAAVATLLEEARLVRREPHHGAAWFELAHDRLIEPVRRDNRRWFEDNPTDQEKRAALWRSHGRDPRLLLIAEDLERAETEAGDRSLSPEEETFLAACREADKADKSRRNRNRRRTGWLITAVLVLLPLVAARFYGSGLRKGLDAQVRAQKATRLDLALLLTLAIRPEGEPDGRELSETLESSPRLQKILHGHEETAQVLAVAFSPRRGLLASAGTDGLVQIWDAATGKPARPPLKGLQQIWTAAFSPDGRRIAFGGRDSALYVWDMASTFPVRLGPGRVHGGRDVYAVRFSPDGRLLASAGGDGTVWLWDLETRRPLRVLSGHGEEWVTCLAFSPDGRTLASGSRDRTVRLWDPASGEALATLEGEHADWVTDLAFEPHGRTLASAGLDGTVVFWNLESRRARRRLEGLAGPLTGVAYSPDGRILAVGGLDGTLTLRDTRTLRPLAWPLTGQARFLRSLAFNPDGRTLASGSGSKVVLWKLEGGSNLGEALAESLPLDEVTAVATTPDGRWAAVSGIDRATRGSVLRLLWPDGRLRRGPWPTAGRPARSLALSGDGRLLASGGDDGSLEVRETASGTVRGRARHADRVSGLAFSPDGRMLASASWDGTIVLRDPATLRPTATLRGHQGRVLAVAFKPDGTTLASAGLDRTIRLWDLKSAGGPIVLEGHADRVSSLAFSADGATLASGSWDAMVSLWTRTPERTPDPQVKPLRGHVLPVLHLAFAPGRSGNTLASAGWDYKVALWDTKRQTRLTPLLSLQRGRVAGLVFAPDGRTLLTVGVDGSLARWQTDPRDWHKTACAIANRPLTETEWCDHIGPLPLYDPVCPAAGDEVTWDRFRAARDCAFRWAVEPIIRTFRRQP